LFLSFSECRGFTPLSVEPLAHGVAARSTRHGNFNALSFPPPKRCLVAFHKGIFLFGKFQLSPGVGSAGTGLPVTRVVRRSSSSTEGSEPLRMPYTDPPGL
jgi:hypothetical protein